MAKRKAEPPPEEEISQEVPEQEETPEPESDAVSENDEAMSKAEMVRQAVAAGMESPGDGTAYIKKHFHVDLPRQMWSSYRAQQKAREAKANGETPRIRATPSAPSHASHTAIPQGLGAAIKEVRGLMDKLGGPDETKEIIGQLNGLIGKYGAGGLGEIIDALG